MSVMKYTQLIPKSLVGEFDSIYLPWNSKDLLNHIDELLNLQIERYNHNTIQWGDIGVDIIFHELDQTEVDNLKNKDNYV